MLCAHSAINCTVVGQVDRPTSIPPSSDSTAVSQVIVKLHLQHVSVVNFTNVARKTKDTMALK